VDLVERRAGGIHRHPWELARARFFAELLRRLEAWPSTRAVLDVGAGDAWLAGELARAAPGVEFVCWDAGYEAADLDTSTAASPRLRLTAQAPTGRFDALLLLDVIEHVEDDRGFLREVTERNLSDDGWALVSVPAYQSLFSDHDVALRHFRRYAPDQCRRVLEGAGLRVVAEGGLFLSLLVARWLQVRTHRLRRGRAEATGVGAWQREDRVSRALTAILGTEARVDAWVGARGTPVVPGLSYWAFCRPATP
jgi:2-polyprenyl-3-methyl-5-hydroxy-6-metoxy-1,4-benzoquinol methylase